MYAYIYIALHATMVNKLFADIIIFWPIYYLTLIKDKRNYTVDMLALHNCTEKCNLSFNFNV